MSKFWSITDSSLPQTHTAKRSINKVILIAIEVLVPYIDTIVDSGLAVRCNIYIHTAFAKYFHLAGYTGR